MAKRIFKELDGYGSRKGEGRDVKTDSPTCAPFSLLQAPGHRVTALCENSRSPGEAAGMGPDLLRALGKLRLEIKIKVPEFKTKKPR